MGFLQKLFAATPENPRFSLNDPAAWDALGAVPSSAGVQVNEETALTHSPWWRGITLLANDVAKLPLCVLSVTGGMDKKPAKKHPAYQLLRWKANEFQTAGVWKKQMMGHALSRGNGYSYILRNGAGDPQELLPLNPYDTYPVRENGKLWYVTRVVSNQIPGGGEDRKLASEDIFHLKGFGFDGLIGYSVIDKAREVLGLGMAERKYQAIYFRNNARPSIVLLHPGVLGDKTKDELRQSWERMQSGLENAHRTAVLDRGLTVKDLSFNSADSEIIASRQFDLIDIANFVGVPPHKLGANIATSYGSLEQENQSYLDSGLDPWLCALEEEARDKLLTEGEKDGDTVEVGFDRGKLIRANLTDRTNYYRTALGGQPWMTQEEVRLEEGMNPEPDVGEIKAPLNMGPPGGPPHPGAPPAPGNGDQPPGAPPVPPGKRPPGKPPVAPPAPPKKPKKKAARKQARLEAHAALLADAVRRNVVRVGHRAERAAVDPAKFLAWVDGLRAEQFGLALDSLAPVERVVFIAGEHQGQAVAPWLLGELHSEYSALADRATAKQLVGECAALAADQAVRLSAVAARKFLAFDPDQPRDDHGRFGTGDDEKEGDGKPSKKEHEDKAKSKFAESLRGDKQLSNGKRREYYKAASEVHEAMPARALERYNANTAGHRFHEDAAALTEALKRDVPTLQLAAGTMAGGAYRPKSRTLELDGGMDEMRQSTREVYAHEMTHAVDGPGHELSGSGGWREAYQQEIAGGRLSAYAKKSPAEGFAEFGRAVYGGKANKGAIEAHFPKSAKFFKDQGIW